MRAWTPPSGARLPGEPTSVCAARELEEETGIGAEPVAVRAHGTDWAVFVATVPWGTPVVVDGVEHDRHEWVTLEEACRRCLPPRVADSLRLAARHAGDEEPPPLRAGTGDQA